MTFSRQGVTWVDASVASAEPSAAAELLPAGASSMFSGLMSLQQQHLHRCPRQGQFGSSRNEDCCWTTPSAQAARSDVCLLTLGRPSLTPVLAVLSVCVPAGHWHTPHPPVHDVLGVCVGQEAGELSHVGCCLRLWQVVKLVGVVKQLTTYDSTTAAVGAGSAQQVGEAQRTSITVANHPPACLGAVCHCSWVQAPCGAGCPRPCCLSACCCCLLTAAVLHNEVVVLLVMDHLGTGRGRTGRDRGSASRVC
jgi:hypothetical protein